MGIYKGAQAQETPGQTQGTLRISEVTKTNLHLTPSLSLQHYNQVLGYPCYYHPSCFPGGSVVKKKKKICLPMQETPA